jgi:phosphoglycerate dehydrogenase-like enzyme
MPRAVLDMADRRPMWAMPDWVPVRLRERLPAGWDLVLPEGETDGAGDGATRATPELLEATIDAEIYFGYGISEDLLKARPGLKWVHSGAAGVGKSLSPAMLSSPVVFTNSAGVHAPPIAETVLAMILHFGRGLDFALEGQRRAQWWKDPYYAADAPLFELADATVGIVGFGGIGKEVARRVASLGARVVALKRSAATPEDAALQPVGGGASLADRIDVRHGRSGLDRLLDESDVLVLTAPETAETRGMIDGAALARLRPGALLVNVARGKLVEEAPLLEALSSGRLRGAGLDVFWEEPLPEGHPLWELRNVVLTPHVSGVTRGFWRRETDLIVRNLERYLAGVPTDRWENVVDKRAGY